MTDHFAHDDAAYVLGALSPEEHAAFEAHLATCAQCRAHVAEVSALPGMLAGITEADLADTSLSSVPDTLLPSLLREARRRRRRRYSIGAAVAGVAAAAIVALSLALVSPGSSNAPAHAMVALRATPVSATAAMKDMNWGTRITLVCHYSQQYGTKSVYSLVVVDKSGASHAGGNWTLTPATTSHLEADTSVHLSQISYIQIVADNQPILQLNV
ncbi:MAG TPA: zf-HC2 domain-containing protein [Jatrophihabitantaceae bacterium]|nr:zf-HC2 domain-containing protein [Jatrophihabitantaceae bacterium]